VVLFVIVGVILLSFKPVLAHASCVSSTLLASVKSVNSEGLNNGYDRTKQTTAVSAEVSRHVRVGQTATHAVRRKHAANKLQLPFY